MIRILSVSCWLLFCAVAASAGDPPPGCVRVTAKYWHDADTPKGCVIYLPLGVMLDASGGIRASDCDAWEVGGRRGVSVTDEEKAKGRAALAALIERFDELDFLFEPARSEPYRDVYGRPLGRIWLKCESTGEWERHGEWVISGGWQRPAKAVAKKRKRSG